MARVASAGDVPAAVADFLKAHNLPANLVRAPDADLDAIPWANQPTLALEARRAEEPDSVSVTAAFGGVAETGTLVLVSGGDQPTTLNFLPENHVVVLWADRISGDYEAQWSALRERYGERRPAPHGQPGHRPVAQRRYRADHPARRPRPAPAPYRDRR